MMRRILLLLLIATLSGNIRSQVYEACVENDELVNQNTFEFDVCIKSVSDSFELTSYQCVFTYHSKITNGGTLSFSYIPGSSGINNIPNYGIGINNTDGINKLTFASMPGNDIIDTAKKKIGRFSLENTAAFGPYLSQIINLTWSFEGIISTILTGSNFANITNPSNHISQMDGLTNLIINQSVASDTSYLINYPGKTFDGFGFFDGDPESKWASQPTPQWISYDLGSEKAISLTRFSFQNFNLGRKYIYSVFLSSDNINWVEAVANDTSDLIEYTENIFEPKTGRYVKLLLISNNQNNWATLWEAEIWGGEEIIPVELSSFSGYIENDKIILNWTTNSELNNSGFEIERKIENSNFEKINFIPGQGTTTSSFNYTFSDNHLTQGRYAYRLKQIDYDGSYTFSNILEFDLSNFIHEFHLDQNYPNPFNPQTSIRFDIKEQNFVDISVYNILGEKVKELVNNVLDIGSHEIKFDGTDLASGIYICKLDVKDKYTATKKMLLLK